MFLPIASTLVSHPPPGWWWLVLVGWAFVWPHLAWQIASRAVDPLSREIYNLKTDAVLAGMWVGVMGVNVLPSTAMLMIMCLNLMGAGGPRLFVAGLVLMVVSCLVTLELTGITVSFNSAPLEWWLSLPIIVIYPLLFGWVSYQTATKLAEHKRRLQVMSTRDGMTGVYNRRHWETMLRNEFDNCRRHNRDATLLIIDIDHFKSINDTWGHDVGDEAIVALTRQLQITLRGSDVIGRFGGDEFAVIMSGTPAESAITAMLRVHEGLNTLRLPNTPQVTLRISVDRARVHDAGEPRHRVVHHGESHRLLRRDAGQRGVREDPLHRHAHPRAGHGGVQLHHYPRLVVLRQPLHHVPVRALRHPSVPGDLRGRGLSRRHRRGRHRVDDLGHRQRAHGHPQHHRRAAAERHDRARDAPLRVRRQPRRGRRHAHPAAGGEVAPRRRALRSPALRGEGGCRGNRHRPGTGIAEF